MSIEGSHFPGKFRASQDLFDDSLIKNVVLNFISNDFWSRLLENNENILSFFFRIIILINNQYLAKAYCSESHRVIRDIFIFVVKEAVRVDFSDNVFNIE